jgi:SOS-response transcriptional repressor LexA
MELSNRQLEALNTIATWRDGLLSVSSIAPVLGCAGESSARRVIEPLEKQGLIERQALGPGLPKIIHLTHTGRRFLGLTDEAPEISYLNTKRRSFKTSVPVSCGVLTEQATEADFVAHPHAEWRSGDYYAYSKGDSMWDAKSKRGIPPGVKTQMRPGIWPEDGKVVHLIITHDDGTCEDTMKVFFQCHRTGTVTLQAINPDYADIVLSAEAFNDATRDSRSSDRNGVAGAALSQARQEIKKRGASFLA